MARKHKRSSWGCLFTIFATSIILFATLLVLMLVRAQDLYGAASKDLSPVERVQYAGLVLWHDRLLTRPANNAETEQAFVIEPGERVSSIAGRLERQGLILSSAAFRDYLIYKGYDMRLQSGSYTIAPTLSTVQVANLFLDATPTEITFVVLAGWRMEEIAASLPVSGLNITPDEFIAQVKNPPGGYDFLPPAVSAEGFLHPGKYILPRTASEKDLIQTLMRGFALQLTPEMRAGFERQGLTVYQAVILASVVEREAVNDDEKAMIASVFLNRHKIGMRLDADPTVQYAVGYNPEQSTWWTNPLTFEHLRFDSPYNTYIYTGLPPGPIANPSNQALMAVAFPAETPYYFFRAKCDGSGYHYFAENYEQHLANACP